MESSDKIHAAIMCAAIGSSLRSANLVRGEKDMSELGCFHESYCILVDMLFVMLDVCSEMRTRRLNDDERDVVVSDESPVDDIRFFDNAGRPCNMPQLETTTNPIDFPGRLCPQRYYALQMRRLFAAREDDQYPQTRKVVLSMGFMYNPLYIASLYPCSHSVDAVIRAIGMGFDDNSIDETASLTETLISCTVNCSTCTCACMASTLVVAQILRGHAIEASIDYACVRSGFVSKFISLGSITTAADCTNFLFSCLRRISPTSNISDFIEIADSIGCLESRSACMVILGISYGLIRGIGGFGNIRSWLPNYTLIRSRIHNYTNRVIML